MTEDQIAAINSTHMDCVRFAKALIVAGRKLGAQLNELLPSVTAGLPATEDEDEFFAAQDEAWTKLVTKTFGIPAEMTFILGDYSLLPEVQNAPALPAQAMTLYDALKFLAYLVPTDETAECVSTT